MCKIRDKKKQFEDSAKSQLKKVGDKSLKFSVLQSHQGCGVFIVELYSEYDDGRKVFQFAIFCNTLREFKVVFKDKYKWF